MSKLACLKLFLVALFCCYSSWLSAMTVDQLQQQLTTHKLLRGEFTQTKQLQMFNQPLISQGSFVLSHQQGLIWLQQSPFPVSIILANNRLSQQFSGQQAEVIEAKDNPMVFYFTHLFLSLFKGDLSELKKQFSVQLNEEKQGQWVLNLIPLQSPLNKVFKSIDITGSTQIEALKMVELSGDFSLIEFSAITYQPETLSQQESDAFKF